MAGPKTLNQADETSFSTWYVGKSTKFCAENLDSTNLGIVRILAGAQGEDVNVSPRGTVCIDRQWGGLPLKAINRGQAQMKVWTE